MDRWVGRCGTTDDFPVYFLFTNPGLMMGLRTTPWVPMSSAKVAETPPPHHTRWKEGRGLSGPVIGPKTRKIISFGGPGPVKGEHGIREGRLLFRQLLSHADGGVNSPREREREERGPQGPGSRFHFPNRILPGLQRLVYGLYDLDGLPLRTAT
ncbi:uncharacterized protein LY79DRAFT_111587 [Colletotrichum navitas]|uniref:Uncharacterized protein n=1 Tax=Colletotrichum navitas TaxID=681940 RepID=A0AAD8V700_9PEZI|nr:uncharacterized protein LY79DRAFT_111587 [Colletotrichum navitas]KAK1595369.1 hypothetical protein LY79DRAFT_111587 [Colletotrichum navitas]